MFPTFLQMKILFVWVVILARHMLFMCCCSKLYFFKQQPPGSQEYVRNKWLHEWIAESKKYYLQSQSAGLWLLSEGCEQWGWVFRLDFSQVFVGDYCTMKDFWKIVYKQFHRHLCFQEYISFRFANKPQ